MAVDPYLINRAVASFPAGGAPVLTTPGALGTRPGLRARSAAHAAFKAVQQHLTNLASVAVFADPELATDALPEVRQGLVSVLRHRTGAQFDDPSTGFIRVAERAHEEAKAAADQYRPKLDPESTSQMIRTDQAWNNHIRPMLEAGKQWDEIIQTLDADGLLAAKRFAHGYESNKRGRFAQNEVPSVLAGIEMMSERRVVDIAPPEGREALREAQDAATALEYTRTIRSWAAEADTRSATSFSIGLTRETWLTGAQNPVETSPDALASYTASLTAA